MGEERGEVEYQSWLQGLPHLEQVGHALTPSEPTIFLGVKRQGWIECPALNLDDDLILRLPTNFSFKGYLKFSAN